MNALELIRFQLDTSKALTTSLLADMLDAPLTEPTPKGGNHPTWVAGHLAYSEANLTSHILSGQENPLIVWKDLFGRGSEPQSDAAQYPSLEDLLGRWDEVRSRTQGAAGHSAHHWRAAGHGPSYLFDIHHRTVRRFLGECRDG